MHEFSHSAIHLSDNSRPRNPPQHRAVEERKSLAMAAMKAVKKASTMKVAKSMKKSAMKKAVGGTVSVGGLAV